MNSAVGMRIFVQPHSYFRTFEKIRKLEACEEIAQQFFIFSQPLPLIFIFAESINLSWNSFDLTICWMRFRSNAQIGYGNKYIII